MFSMLENLTKAVVGAVIETPVAIVADVVTLGGSLTDRDKPYTAESVEKVVDSNVCLCSKAVMKSVCAVDQGVTEEK